jgi:hypothetical protein
MMNISFSALTFAIFCCSISDSFRLKSKISKFCSCHLSSIVPNTPSPLTQNGLLAGVSNITSASYYSVKLPLKEAAEFIRYDGLLYDIIGKECNSDQRRMDEYLQLIFEQMEIFMKTNKVWDRSDLINGLDSATETTGNFVCLLGGEEFGVGRILSEGKRQ